MDQQREHTAEEVHIPFTEKLKSIPEIFGIRLNEEPSYEVLKKEGAFELRHYERQLHAKVILAAESFDEFREKAFNMLANYIFEGNDQKQSVAMTSPVLLEDVKQDIAGAAVISSELLNSWSMTFILPEKFTLATAPNPHDASITLSEVAAHDVAAITYSGNNSEDQILLHERDLRDWIFPQTNLKVDGDAIVAQYDAPFVIPFLKKNEILIRVKANSLN